MENKPDILELRQRLDRTLRLPDLLNEESIQSLVEDQLLRSSFSSNEGDLRNVVARRTKEVSNFLAMLRSASDNEIDASKTHGSSNTDWKLKQDTDQLRVMYSEGPHGTPFHTLLTEGYGNGSPDVCLCVSWDATLYKKWWPQFNIPTFKITMSSCLQKVRIGEEVSLIRMKVPWPVSEREALLHYFEVDYFKEDLVLVLINTISDIEHVDASTHGFTSDGIPEAKDAIRVDLVGGFVLQKVNANGSYFRSILNMDMKMDFVSPTLINFMSRQLIGSGYKLYQKAVASVASTDEDYRKALKDPMFVRVREGLSSRSNKLETTIECSEEEKHRDTYTEEQTTETAVEKPPSTNNTFVNEIVEEETEHIEHLEQNASMNVSHANVTSDQYHIVQKGPPISPGVEQALGILDRAIALVRGGSFRHIQSHSTLVDEETATSIAVAEAFRLSDKTPSSDGALDKPSDEHTSSSTAKDFRCNGGSSTFGEAYHIPALPEKSLKYNQEDTDNSFSNSRTAFAPGQTATLDNIKVLDDQSFKASSPQENGVYSDTKKPSKKKQHRSCCFDLSLIRS